MTTLPVRMNDHQAARQTQYFDGRKARGHAYSVTQVNSKKLLCCSNFFRYFCFIILSIFFFDVAVPTLHMQASHHILAS